MAKKVAFLGIFTALGMVLGWLESLMPIYLVIPGMKIGLANMVTLLVLYRFSWKEAAVVNLLRIGLSILLFGTPSLLPFSVAGALFSLVGMTLLKKTDKCPILVVSVVGAILHNLGQLIMAIFILRTGILATWIPILVLAGGIAGVLIGVVGAFLHKHLPKEIS